MNKHTLVEVMKSLGYETIRDVDFRGGLEILNLGILDENEDPLWVSIEEMGRDFSSMFKGQIKIACLREEMRRRSEEQSWAMWETA